jgi:hypothetical protein
MQSLAQQAALKKQRTSMQLPLPLADTEHFSHRKLPKVLLAIPTTLRRTP